MPPTTPKELNEEYDRFWKEQAELLHRRMANDAVREAALGLIREQELHLPVRYRFSLEAALEKAEKTGQRCSAEWSRKGGKAKKTDTLQLVIEKIVADRPSTTLRQLEQQLRALERIEVIDEIADDLISFTAANGRFKGAKLSGLKHRLSRAKKKPRSR